MVTFRKTGSVRAIRSEVASLRWLAEAGGARVVDLVAHGDRWLETRRLAEAPPHPDDAAEFGRALALTHAAGAPWWAAGPPGLAPDDSLLADLPQPVVASAVDAPGTWGEFYAEYRVRPYLRIAVDAGAVGQAERTVVERALARVEGGEFDVPQPGGCPSVARLHGDLWAGNVLWAAGPPDAGHTGRRTVGTLIDPAAHGGHAETDLAELALFGAPHLDQIRAGYDEVAPLASGWRHRVALHQLHMLAVHAAKFGGGYGRQLAAAAAQYV